MADPGIDELASTETLIIDEIEIIPLDLLPSLRRLLPRTDSPGESVPGRYGVERRCRAP
jgi:hypothetical protein